MPASDATYVILLMSVGVVNRMYFQTTHHHNSNGIISSDVKITVQSAATSSLQFHEWIPSCDPLLFLLERGGGGVGGGTFSSFQRQVLLILLCCKRSHRCGEGRVLSLSLAHFFYFVSWRSLLVTCFLSPFGLNKVADFLLLVGGFERTVIDFTVKSMAVSNNVLWLN